MPGVLLNPFGIFQDALAFIFYRYGLYISKNPTPFIIVPVLLTSVLSLGILNFNVADDLRFLYSPEHSLSRFEYSVHKSFNGDLINSSYIAVALESSDGNKNMLRKEVADTVTEFLRYVQHNMTITLDDQSVNFGTEICPREVLCPLSNTIVQIFYDTYYSEKLRNDSRVQMEWPTLKFFDNKFFLPTNFYGVDLDPVAQGFEKIVSFETVHLIFYVAGSENHTADQIGKALEKSLSVALADRSQIIKSSMFSISILKEEMQKNTTYTLPFISLTVIFLVTFTVCSCMTGDWITSKPLEALMGIVVSSFAIGSSGGLLLAMGVPYISQVTVMPFLAFAIGVDDIYVMLGAWQDTKRTLPPEKRMAQTLEEAGSAITVTSLTSCLSFGIGTFSSTPAISIFCKYITLAIFFDYIYQAIPSYHDCDLKFNFQITLFAAIMSLGGRREAAGYHCIFVWRKMSKEDTCKAKRDNTASVTHNLFANILAPFLCKKSTRVAFAFIYGIYIFFAFYGCSLLKPDLTPSRLLVDDSPLAHYLQLAQSRLWSEGVVGRVYVNRAPDFSTHPEEIETMLKMVEELENTPYSMGANSTQIWLREFNNYRQYFAEDDANFYETFKSFLGISFNKQWSSFIHWADNPNREGKKYVEKFFFTTAFKIPDWNVRTNLLLIWRNITAKYPQYQALVFDENNFFSDQMLELKSTTLNSLGTAIIAMIIICVLFIAESTIVYWVTFILVSMDIGVAGYLSLWGADLDPTTVVNILMSIGLCIDFATHVGYRIYRSQETDPDRRIADALGAIGWPVVQAGFSTLLAIVVMMLVPSNVVRMFARTSILVVATGLFHGIFILPIICRTFASNHLIKEPSDKQFLIEKPPQPTTIIEQTKKQPVEEVPLHEKLAEFDGTVEMRSCGGGGSV
ncbi:Patched domain-containing protein 3 [Aphelenchoides besseyi]|nr:Patched domain-containing protein 3 [Aphelenchoides besseyi]KAI6232306.1 Patched domain-containing protein 3 [Aphelenchoides besseyi]